MSAVIKIKQGLTWGSALGGVVRKGPCEKVILGNGRLSLKNGEYSVYGSGTEQWQRNERRGGKTSFISLLLLCSRTIHSYKGKGRIVKIE